MSHNKLFQPPWPLSQWVCELHHGLQIVPTKIDNKFILKHKSLCESFIRVNYYVYTSPALTLKYIFHVVGPKQEFIVGTILILLIALDI